MPKFNDLSALLLKRFIESGTTDPVELANIMGNSAVETANFKTMHEYFGYTSAQKLINKVSSADDRFTRKEVEDAVSSRDPVKIATVMYDKRVRGLGNTEPGDGNIMGEDISNLPAESTTPSTEKNLA